jgi:hypothetical protein
MTDKNLLTDTLAPHFDFLRRYLNADDNPSSFDGLRSLERIEQAVLSRQPAASPLAWIHEDELPEGYPYDAMFPYSKVGGVRMFPVFGPAASPKDSETAPVDGDLRQAVKRILDDFTRQEQGEYHSRDRCFAIEVLGHAIDTTAASPKDSQGAGFREFMDAAKEAGITHLPSDFAQKLKAASEAGAVPYQRRQAIKEGERNDAERKYFEARPHMDTTQRRKAFCAGFDRGYDVAPPAPSEAGAVPELLEDFAELISDLSYEANQEMDQEKATRAAFLERVEQAFRAALAAPSDAPAQWALECERCGEPPEAHTANHPCSNRSFRLPAPAAQQEPPNEQGDERTAISNEIGFEFTEGELQECNADDLLCVYRAGYNAALSKPEPKNNDEWPMLDERARALAQIKASTFLDGDEIPVLKSALSRWHAALSKPATVTQGDERAKARPVVIGRVTVKGRGRSSVDLDTSHTDLPEGDYELVARAAMSAPPAKGE